MNRHDGRAHDQLRKTTVTYNVFQYAAGSVFFQMGKTKVLCAVTLTHSVPIFLRNQGKGWLTAEYSLLPASTMSRTTRESSIGKRNGRSVEISRLIGRSLRSVVNLQQFGEQTIHIDCDVLQADGGTRAACITGAYLALRAAQTRWLKKNMITKPIITDELAAISVGVMGDTPLLDLDYKEDSTIDADFNFVMTRSGKIIEMQGASEQAPIDWQHVQKMYELAHTGVEQLLQLYASDEEVKAHSGGFSLADRLGKQVSK